MNIVKNKIIKIIFISIVSILLIFTLANNIFAFNENDINTYEPGSSTNITNASELLSMGNIIVDVLQAIGVILSVAILGILGIKYMMGSVEERAEYKRTLMPYIIGAFMIFGITSILELIVTIVNSIFT